MNWIASSNVMFRSMASLFLIVSAKPVIGMGEVGIRTARTGSLAAASISTMLSLVTSASDQIPRRGHSTATTREYSISRSLRTKSLTCLTAP